MCGDGVAHVTCPHATAAIEQQLVPTSLLKPTHITTCFPTRTLRACIPSTPTSFIVCPCLRSLTIRDDCIHYHRGPAGRWLLAVGGARASLTALNPAELLEAAWTSPSAPQLALLADMLEQHDAWLVLVPWQCASLHFQSSSNAGDECQ